MKFVESKKVMIKQCLSDIDRCLYDIKVTANDNELHELVNKFAICVLEYLNIDYGESNEPIDILLNSNYKGYKESFIAVCLLRLFNIKDEYFRNNDYNIKLLKLFDDAFEENLYKCLKISKNMQSYEKESRLIDVVIKTEDRIKDQIEGFNNLSNINAFRNSFMQTLNAKVTKYIIWPFLPNYSSVKQRLNDVFSVVNDYYNEKGTGVLYIYEKAINIIEEFIQFANDHGSYYSTAFLGGFAKKLLEFIKEHFRNNPINKSADLDVNTIDKKYPFHEKNKKIEMYFVVKNKSDAFAYDTKISAVSMIEDEPKLVRLGRIEPRSQQEIRIDFYNRFPQDEVLVEIEVEWNNYNKTRGKKKREFLLESQRRDIDWESLKKKEPFSLEPVETEEELVGRKEQLDELESIITNERSVGSAFVFGQKRVGKTSIVKTLKNRIERIYKSKYLIIYLESGDYITPDPHETIDRLGKRIIKAIKDSDKRFDRLSDPNFSGALSPITEFLNDVISIKPDTRIVFILDEFDELPIDLYKRSKLGDAFFQTIRSISNKKEFGFILVGGEIMSFIISCQGEPLNKFKSLTIDYFDKEEHLSDFRDLVVMPVSEWLEYSDDAIHKIFDYTAGNPFFTKYVCSELFKIMVESRDNFITEREVEKAVSRAIKKMASNQFQHFWDDGIIESGVREEEKSIKRRKILLIISELLNEGEQVNIDNIKKLADKYYISEDFIVREVSEFERRNILVKRNNKYDIKVKLFKKWLLEKGSREIITTLVDVDALQKEKQEEEKARIQEEELINLVNRWGIYKGREITTDKIRSWLNQFGSNKEQRLVFKILENLKFYSQSLIRQKMSEAKEIVFRKLVRYKKEKQKKIGNILVSYLDRAGKSGSYLARLFVEENDIYKDNLISREKIKDKLMEISNDNNAYALVIVDDFIGTGNALCEYLEELNNECGEILRDLISKDVEVTEAEKVKKLQLHCIAVCGFTDAKSKIENKLNEIGIPASINICDPLNDEDKIFNEKSRIFNNIERKKAEEIAYEFGSKLEKRYPFGYGNCQTAVVFEHNCPNNCLPILWAKSKEFEPLFERS